MLVPLWLSWSSLLSIVGCGPCDNTYIYMNNSYEEKKVLFFLLRCEKVLSLAPTWSPGRTKKRWQDGGSTPAFTYNSNYVPWSQTTIWVLPLKPLHYLMLILLQDGFIMSGDWWGYPVTPRSIFRRCVSLFVGLGIRKTQSFLFSQTLSSWKEEIKSKL